MKRIIGAVFAVWGLVGSILSACFVAPLILPFAVLPRGKRERYTIVVARAWARFVVQWVLLAKVHVRGTVDPDRGALVVCNHQSWLDPLLLIGWTSSNGLSKKLVLYIPAIGYLGWLAGAVYFDRRSAEQRAAARADVLHLIRSGFRVQLFPEGTRSKDGGFREKVYLSLAMDCWDQGLPVVPCAVSCTQAVLPIAFAAHLGQDAYLSLGQPMEPAAYGTAQEFADATWKRVKELRAELP